MKNLYTLLFLFITTIFIQAQTPDTVLYEGFQTNVFPNMANSASGNDPTWVNYDQDGLPAITGLAIDQLWNYKEFYFQPLDSMTGETNFVAGSYSFLENSLPGNRNYLITPPIQIVNNTYTLHWRSSPSQLPRYMDGYSVMAQVGSNNTAGFTDTLFRAAQMVAITGNGQSLDLSNFSFSTGYLHANGLTLTNYFQPNSGNTVAYGKLEPHSVSLANYAGKTVYFAFLHDSDDDDRIAIDDILITRTSTTGTQNPIENSLQFVSYPNPVDNYMDLMFNNETPQEVNILIMDISGKEIMNIKKGIMGTGQQFVKLDLQSLPRGMYAMKFNSGENIVAKFFRKR